MNRRALDRVLTILAVLLLLLVVLLLMPAAALHNILTIVALVVSYALLGMSK